MPRRYSTRSATKVARSSKAPEQLIPSTAAVTPAGPRRDSSNVCSSDNTTSNEAPTEEAEGTASPSDKNGGRKPSTLPLPLHLAGADGEQRGTAVAPLPLPPHRDRSDPAGAASASVSIRPVVAAAQVGAEKPPSGGGSGGDRPRKRSRLSLSRHRASPAQQTVVAPPSALPPIDETKKGEGNGGAVVGCFPGGVWPRLSEGRVGSARRPPPEAPRSSPPPPPPFVGLENMGETCYVNAVLQSLAACREALKSKHEAGGAFGEASDQAEERRREGRDGAGPSAGTPADCGHLASAEAAWTGLGAGNDGNPVFHTLGSVLREIESRNRTLVQQQSVAAAPSPQTALTPPALSARGPTAPDMSGFTPPGEEGPSQVRPGVATPDDPGPGAITPTALVELIRGGWLGAEPSTGGVGTAAGPAAVPSFGTGQACVSELLGKFLDVGEAAAYGEEDGREDAHAGCVGEQGSVGSSSSFCGLAGAYRGALCARTLCVECERDRTSREEFTELTLPPLAPPPPLPPPPPPPLLSPRHVATHGETAGETRRGGGSKPTPKAQTLQALVDAALFGRESLGGGNKVWCDACRQWNEAERRSSLCSPPALLALHVRPGEKKRSSSLPSPCPYPAAAITAAGGNAFGGAPESGGGDVGRGDPHGETKRGRSEEEEGSGDHGELIERVLVVNSASRCRQVHSVAAADSGSSGDGGSGIPAGKARQQQLGGGKKARSPEEKKQRHRQQPRVSSGDVFYDLIGAILHKGQTLGSGHYTFALHAGGLATPGPKDDPPADLPAPALAAGSSSAAGAREHEAPSPGEKSRESRRSESAHGIIEGSRGGGRGGDAKPAFALFDDAVVRWLSPEEELAVLNGGGGGLGDAFLVFYVRRA